VNAGPRWRLADADKTVRLFITSFLLLLTCGYAVGLLFAGHTTSGTAAGLSEEYRGTPEGSERTELKYAKSEDEMYIFLHNHLLSLSLVFFSVGGIFYFSKTPGGLKRFLMLEPFAALVTTFGGIWLVRFASPWFSWLVMLSGIAMAGCVLVMIVLILKELWGGR